MWAAVLATIAPLCRMRSDTFSVQGKCTSQLLTTSVDRVHFSRSSLSNNTYRNVSPWLHSTANAALFVSATFSPLAVAIKLDSCLVSFSHATFSFTCSAGMSVPLFTGCVHLHRGFHRGLRLWTLAACDIYCPFCLVCSPASLCHCLRKRREVVDD